MTGGENNEVSLGAALVYTEKIASVRIFKKWNHFFMNALSLLQLQRLLFIQLLFVSVQKQGVAVEVVAGKKRKCDLMTTKVTGLVLKDSGNSIKAFIN